MFGNNKKDSAPNGTAKGAGTGAPTGHALNSLTQGTVVEGTIKASTDIRIDGLLKGKLFCDAKVIVGPTGAVEGEIKCQNAVIEGKFTGSIVVEELLNVRESAVINGDVKTGKLVVQPGGIFNVKCEMGSGTQRGNTSSNPLMNKDANAKPEKANAV